MTRNKGKTATMCISNGIIRISSNMKQNNLRKAAGKDHVRTSGYCYRVLRSDVSRLLQNKVNVLDYSTVFLDMSRLDKHASSYRG